MNDLEEQEEDAPLPALFEHCCTVYKRMEEDAKLVEVETISQNTGAFLKEELVWEGYLTKLFGQLHFSVPYYTSVTRKLKEMGCVAQKRRGGGNAPSQWLILTEPTEELFRLSKNATSHHLASKKANKVEMLEQQVRDMGTIVSKIQSDYDIIIEILMEKEKEAHNV